METAWKEGLEDVIAARSAICRVDSEAGGSTTAATRSATWRGR